MNILAIDTSSQAGSAAYMEGGQLIGEQLLLTGLTHSETALPQVVDLLAKTNRSLDDVELLAVSHGPGSFTGLRIGLSLAKGLAFGRKIKTLGVSTLSMLAANLPYSSHLIVPVMDARRNQMYTNLFTTQKGLPQSLGEDRILIVPELGELLSKEHSSSPILLLGDGAEMCYRQLEESHPALNLVSAPPHLRYQRASSLAWMAHEAARSSPEALSTGADLSPVYLRIPQAERERLEHRSNYPS